MCKLFNKSKCWEGFVFNQDGTCDAPFKTDDTCDYYETEKEGNATTKEEKT